jgi:hypothetical protein
VQQARDAGTNSAKLLSEPGFTGLKDEPDYETVNLWQYFFQLRCIWKKLPILILVLSER